MQKSGVGRVGEDLALQTVESAGEVDGCDLGRLEINGVGDRHCRLQFRIQRVLIWE